MRVGSNATIALDIHGVRSSELAGVSTGETEGVATYLGTFEDDEEEIAEALLFGQSEDNESLDAFFADAFRE